MLNTVILQHFSKLPDYGGLLLKLVPSDVMIRSPVFKCEESLFRLVIKYRG